MLFKKRNGTISPFLIGFPLLAMVVSCLLSGSNLIGSSGNYPICNPNAVNCTNTSAATGSTQFQCANKPIFGVIQQLIPTPCALPGPCPAVLPPQTSCSIANIWLLAPGAVIVIPNSLLFAQTGSQPSTSTGSSSANGIFFGFGSITLQGFLPLIAIVVGIVVLAGLSIFSSGESPEAIHIAFLGGTLGAIWLFLSTVDGFTSQSANSMFVQMNYFAFDGLGFGTTAYVLLTLLYFMGFIGTVKRGF